MRITEGLELYIRSVDSYKARLKELKIIDLIELVKGLRLVNKPDIFKISHGILVKDKLFHFYKGIEDLEKNAAKEEGIEELRDRIYEKTGFSIDSETSPSIGLRKIIDEITSWSK